MSLDTTDSVSPLADTTDRTLRDRLTQRIQSPLDRLRAIRISQILNIAIALAVVVLVGRITIGLPLVVQSLVVGGTFGLLVYTSNSEHPLVRLLASGLVFVTGGLLAASLFSPAQIALQSPVTGLLVFVVVIAVGAIGFHVSLALSQGPHHGWLRRAKHGSIRALFGPLSVLGVLTFLDSELVGSAVSAAVDLSQLVLEHIFAQQPAFALYTFPVLLLLTASLARSAVRTLPLDTVVPSERREAAVAYIDATDRGLTYGMYLGVALLLFLPGIVLYQPLANGRPIQQIPTTRQLLVALPPTVRSATASTLMSNVLRGGLLGILLISWGTRTLYRVVSYSRSVSADDAVRRLAPYIGGIVIAIGLAQYIETKEIMNRLLQLVGRQFPESLLVYLEGLDSIGISIVLLVLLGILVVLTLQTVTLVGALSFPRQDMDTAIGAAAVFVLGLVALLLGRVGYGLVGTTAAMLTWDTGVYGRLVRDRLETGTRTNRTELVHFTGSVFTGIAVVALTLTLLLTTQRIAAPSLPNLLALTLIGSGTFVLLRAI